MRLEGKSAIVTGGGRGIGRGIVLGMAREGADVVIADIETESAERVAHEVNELGRKALAVTADVARADDVERMVGDALGVFGRIDVLVNNAGIGSAPGLPFTNNVEADWDRVYAVNVKGVFLTCKAVTPSFVGRRAGRIVNIASIAGLLPATTMPPYSVSKAAVITFTRIVARELAPYGITANAICPGFLWTPLWQRLGERLARSQPAYAGLTAREVFERRLAEAIPAAREQTPEDVAEAAVFLASDAASAVTGQTLCVDGGAVMQ